MAAAAHPCYVTYDSIVGDVLNRGTRESVAIALEERRNTRRRVRLPLRILKLDGKRVDWEGETRDISSRGISFFARQKLSPGSSVGWVVVLPTRIPLVQIQCAGTVVRCRETNAGPAEHTHEVAVRMDLYQCVMPGDWEPGTASWLPFLSLAIVLAVESWWAICSGVRRIFPHPIF